MFRSFENNGTVLRIRFWVERPCNVLKIQTDLALKIGEALDEENLFAPFVREAGLEAKSGMTAGRMQRLKAFYAVPAMAEILNKIGQQIAQASPSAITGETATAVATLPAEDEYADAEEPE